MIRARIAAEELGPLATVVLRETSQAVDWTAAMAAGARVLGHVSTYAENADGTRVALDEASVDAAVDAWTRAVNVTGFLFDVDPGTDNETSVLEAYLDHARTALAAGAAAQLVVDSACFVAFSTKHKQSAELFYFFRFLLGSIRTT